MELTNKEGNSFISPDDIKKLHDGIKLLTPLKTKYYKLGKVIALSELATDIKNQFFSLGRELDKLLVLWEKFGEV